MRIWILCPVLSVLSKTYRNMIYHFPKLLLTYFLKIVFVVFSVMPSTTFPNVIKYCFPALAPVHHKSFLTTFFSIQNTAGVWSSSGNPRPGSRPFTSPLRDQLLTLPHGFPPIFLQVHLCFPPFFPHCCILSSGACLDLSSAG